MPDCADDEAPITSWTFWYWDGQPLGLPAIVQCFRTDYGDEVVDDPLDLFLIEELADRRNADRLEELQRGRSSACPTVGEFVGLVRTKQVVLIGVVPNDGLHTPPPPAAPVPQT